MQPAQKRNIYAKHPSFDGPSRSRERRHLMPKLASRFHLIAPDLPSFGFTTVEENKGYQFTFAGLTKTIQGLVNELSLRRFAMYVFDYGAPVGFNLAVAKPDSVSAIISQNGNAYEEGLGATVSGIEPEAYWLDAALLGRPGMMELQTDLKLDYKSNIERYPLYQQYLRTYRPPVLAMWGKNDTFFIPPGAEAFKRDVPDADVRFLDTGHFALETNVDDFASAILKMAVNA